MPRKKRVNLTPENGSQSQEVQEVAHPHNGPIEKRPQPHGGALNSRGTKGNRGGGDFTSKARAIRIAEVAKRFLDKAPTVAGDPDHPKFSEVGRWAVEQLDGKAKQSLEADLTAKVTIQVTQGLGINPEGS